MLPVPLHINPGSKWRRGFLLLVFFLAIMACIALQALVAIVLAAILSTIFVIYWRKVELVSALLLQATGEVEVQDLLGQVEVMNILPSSVVTEGLLVLHLKNERRRLAVVLWPDSAPTEVLRQWRVYLRWQWLAVHRRETNKN